jgi:hypothetical protein
MTDLSGIREVRRKTMAKRNGKEVDAVMTDRYVRGRMRALVLDLVNDDWSMALRDLERLYRALKTGATTEVDESTRSIPGVVGASIYYDDDGTMVEEFCQGPDELGKCPRAEEDLPVACAGKRLATRGWDIGIAPDADLCPLLTLGLVKRYLAGFNRSEQPRFSPPEKEIQHI